MKIAMANDHAGTKLKNEIKAYLESEGHEVKDFGTYDEESSGRRLPWRSSRPGCTPTR